MCQPKLLETFTALERGVVQGLSTVVASYYANSYYEVAPYMIVHGVYPSADPMFAMNLDSWNKLPEEMQLLMRDVVLRIETEGGAYFEQKDKELIDEMIGKGMKLVTFSDEEAEKLVGKAYDAFWESLAKDIDPATIAKLREMLNS